MIIIDFSYRTFLEIPAFESSIRRHQTRMERMTNTFQVSFKELILFCHLRVNLSVFHQIKIRNSDIITFRD
jgi:hypothetical protein